MATVLMYGCYYYYCLTLNNPKKMQTIIILKNKENLSMPFKICFTNLKNIEIKNDSLYLHFNSRNQLNETTPYFTNIAGLSTNSDNIWMKIPLKVIYSMTSK